MDVQLAVADYQAVDESYIKEQNTLAAFRQMLADVRAIRLEIAQKVQSFLIEIENLKNSRDDMVSMFQSEALQMYPELAGSDISTILNNSESTHPLLQLWEIYAEKVNRITNSIDEKIDILDQEVLANDVAAGEELQILDLYDQFRSYATSKLPTAVDILNELQQISVIPYAEEGSTIVALPAIEQLDPQAAAMVTLQTMNTDAQGDYSDSDDQSDSQDNSQNKYMNYSSGADESQGLASQAMTKKLEPIKIGGVMLLLYMLFGR